MGAIDELKKKENDEQFKNMSEQERRNWRANNLKIQIRHTGLGQFEFVGATEDDVKNNPALMAKFDRAVASYRRGKNDNMLVGGSI